MLAFELFSISCSLSTLLVGIPTHFNKEIPTHFIIIVGNRVNNIFLPTLDKTGKKQYFLCTVNFNCYILYSLLIKQQLCVTIIVLTVIDNQQQTGGVG